MPSSDAARILSETTWPRWWRASVIALTMFVLCSCRAPGDRSAENPLRLTSAHKATSAPRKGTIVSTAQVSDETAKPVSTEALPIKPLNCFDRSPPLPYGLCGPCQRGPAGGCYDDEYLCDGGDNMPEAQVAPDWTIYGLGIEDTVAHYDTLDGHTKVVPANKVCVYAPRFSSVRHITRLAMDEEHARPTGYHSPAPPVLVDAVNIPTTALEQQQPHADTYDRLAVAYENRLQDGAVSTALPPEIFTDALLPYENLQVIKTGFHHQYERALLIEGSDAAITWTQDKAVQILLEGQAAVPMTEIDGPEVVYQVDPPCPGKLRIIKVASTQFAQPGDMIDFTLRYDNIGAQAIGNVTIVDNLTTRLEYVLGSARSSRRAEFFTELNEAESLVLRWEITDPLPPGEGGVVRFQCRVR